MLDRMAAGSLPEKHHIAHRDASGRLYHEECITRDGFDGPYTIVYHQYRPHAQHPTAARQGFLIPRSSAPLPLARRHYRSLDLPRRGGSALSGRIPVLFNDDVVISIVHPSEPDPVYFVNGDADDLFFILEGSGTLRSILGDVRYRENDYLFVPRGLVHRFLPEGTGAQYWLSIECLGGMGLLRQWRNDVGQIAMGAPYCHRDFHRPEFTGPLDEGLRELVVKRQGLFHGFTYDTPLLDVVGWDGAVYPWAFPILNFQPRVGLVHLPPTSHGTFAARGALICSFVPRLVDFHPRAIPCPYPHSSVDCDEFLFYCSGDFTSRRGVARGSISHHPAGIAHGPHPGAYEGSIGSQKTDELAVMIDTVHSLRPTPHALGIEDPGYHESFRDL